MLDQGADSVGDPTQCHAVAIDGRAPKFDGGIVTRLDCVPFSIVVNRDGERFYDEGEDVWPKRYAIWGRLVAAQPDQVAYAIIDSKSINDFMPSVFPPETADTIEGLGQKLGLLGREAAARRSTRSTPPAARDLPRAPSSTGWRPRGCRRPRPTGRGPIAEPPFYGYSLRPGVTFTYLGLRVDDDGPRLDRRGPATPTSGRRARSWRARSSGQGYLAGFGMTIGTVFGRIAGQEAGAHVA